MSFPCQVKVSREESALKADGGSMDSADIGLVKVMSVSCVLGLSQTFRN